MPENRWSARKPIDHLAAIGAMATTFIGVVIISALYVGKDIFVPLSLAILLSFVLAPLIRMTQWIRVPRSVAVIAVVLFAFVILFGVGTLMGQQLAQLAGDLPRYETTIREKVKALRGVSAGDGTLERAADMLKDLSKELEGPAGEPPLRTSPSSIEPRQPIPVVVSSPNPGPLEAIASLIAPLLHPLATTGLIIIFVIFILLQREDLRNRIIRLAGTRDIQRTTAALDDAAARLSRLFLMQLAINAGFGLVIGLGLWAIGVPSPALWGILAAVLRFVPYIGAIIAAVFPLALAAAVDPGWSMLIATGLLFVIVEPIVGHIIEPIFHGQSTGLSPVAVVLAATFWTMLWGPIGLVLATPLTVCLVVLGRHIERLSFIDILLGDKPALEPWELFYQRMLVGDASEAVAQAEEVLKERRLDDYYDAIAMKGLRLAQDDITAGTLEVERAQTIRDTVAELVSDLAEYDDREPSSPDEALPPEAAAAVAATTPTRSSTHVPTLLPDTLHGRWASPTPVICIAGRSPVDEAAALLLADLLTKHGLNTTAHGVDVLTSSNLFRLDLDATALVVLSCLDAASGAHIRNLVRRIRRKAPHVRVLVALWGAEASEAEAVRVTSRADLATTDIRGSIAACVGLAGEGKVETRTAPAMLNLLSAS
jgi:predicted PurR-regulated permease PerM